MSRAFSVSRYEPAGRAPSWKAEGRAPDGRKVRRFFPTKAAAEDFAADANAEVKATGWRAMGLADDQRTEAAKCFEKLADTGHTLTSAVEHYLAHLALTEVSATVKEAIADLQDAKVMPACYNLCATDLRRLVIKAGHGYEKNALRHSFASYHLADCQDAAKTALQLGHKGTASSSSITVNW